MKPHREKLYEEAIERYHRTRARKCHHPMGSDEAAVRYYEWTWAWWVAIQRAFPGAA